MTIELIENCGVNPTPETKMTFPFYNQTTNILQGWSHITNIYENNGNEFANIRFKTAAPPAGADRRYYIPEAKFGQAPSFDTVKMDATCNNQKIYDWIVVRKYNNATHGHDNGVEPRIGDKGIKFNQIDAIVYEMKIDRANSVLLSIPEMVTKLNITQDQARACDSGDDLLLWNWAFQDGNYGGPKFGQNTRINLTKYADKWIRVTVKNTTALTNNIGQVNFYQLLSGSNFDSPCPANAGTAFKEANLKFKNYYLRYK